MYSLTVHIAPAGATEGSTTSLPGHMWYSIEGSSAATEFSYGFAPAQGWGRWPIAPGQDKRGQVSS